MRETWGAEGGVGWGFVYIGWLGERKIMETVVGERLLR